MTPTKLIALFAAAFLSLWSFASFAQTGAGGEFTVHNVTEGNVVVGFYTNDGSGWSNNWLSEQMMPSQTATAAFFAETGSCDQVFQVGWLGSDGSEVLDEPHSINICEATNVYLGDNEIYFD